MKKKKQSDLSPQFKKQVGKRCKLPSDKGKEKSGIVSRIKGRNAIECAEEKPKKPFLVAALIILIVSAAILCIALVILLTYRPVCTVATLQSEGFRMDLEMNVHEVNRYETDFLNSPSPAGVLSTIYFEDFEISEGGWVGDAVRVKEQHYDGDWSMRITGASEEKNSSKEVAWANGSISANETADVIFFTYPQGDFTNSTDGYIVFRVHGNWTDGGSVVTAVATFVLANGTSGNGYQKEFGVNETIVDATPPPLRKVWNGYLFDNMRYYFSLANSSIEDQSIPFNITRLEYKVSDYNEKIFLDSVYIQKVPYSVDYGVWKDIISHNVVTDYIIQVDWTIWIDTDLIPDDTTVAARFVFYGNITYGTSSYRYLSDIITVDNIPFAGGSTYNSTSFGLLHSLPPDDATFGSILLYEFDAELSAWGELYDGRTTQDSELADLNTEDFTVNWTLPIQISSP